MKKAKMRNSIEISENENGYVVNFYIKKSNDVVFFEVSGFGGDSILKRHNWLIGACTDEKGNVHPDLIVKNSKLFNQLEDSGKPVTYQKFTY